MTPAEHEVILRERAAEAEQERRRRRASSTRAGGGGAGGGGGSAGPQGGGGGEEARPARAPALVRLGSGPRPLAERTGRHAYRSGAQVSAVTRAWRRIHAAIDVERGLCARRVAGGDAAGPDRRQDVSHRARSPGRGVPGGGQRQRLGGRGGLGSGGGFYWMPTTGTIFLGGQQAHRGERRRHADRRSRLRRDRIENAAFWLGGRSGSFSAPSPNAVPCDKDLSSATATSRDGSVIVGIAWNGCGPAHAFRWEEKTGMVDLGSLVSGRSTQAMGVSGDGRVVVGGQEARRDTGRARAGSTAGRSCSRDRQEGWSEARAP